MLWWCSTWCDLKPWQCLDQVKAIYLCPKARLDHETLMISRRLGNLVPKETRMWSPSGQVSCLSLTSRIFLFVGTEHSPCDSSLGAVLTCCVKLPSEFGLHFRYQFDQPVCTVAVQHSTVSDVVSERSQTSGLCCYLASHISMTAVLQYGPNIADYSDSKRMGYKLRFYEVGHHIFALYTPSPPRTHARTHARFHRQKTACLLHLCLSSWPEENWLLCGWGNSLISCR